MSHTDTFWKLFWTTVGTLVLLYLVGVLALIYLYDPTKTADAAAVGVIFDPSRDPFAAKRPSDNRPKFSGEYFYQDSLPLSLADWSWGVRVDWNSTKTAYSGTQSFRVTFLQDWSGVRAQAPDIDLSDFDGISLAVYPQNTEDLYIELFDQYGNPFGRQSLGWYTDTGKLQENTWNVVQIPFTNLFPEGQAKRPISGYAISTVHPGIAYIDEVRLQSTTPPHSRWYEPKPIEYVEVPEKPETPASLPYTLQFTPGTSDLWKTIFGRFDVTPNGVRIGTNPQKSTGSMSYIKGGQNWADYRIDTKLYWGQTSAFSILLRYVDDANFVSCAFSHYNEIVQIYSVQNGVSTLIGTSPTLPIDAREPWRDAKASASVKGQVATCYVNGEKVLSATIPEMSAFGKAGLETWTKNTFDSPHTLQEYSVSAI